MPKRRLHKNYILHKEKMPIARVLPGMIIEFKYPPRRGGGDESGDPRPLFFV